MAEAIRQYKKDRLPKDKGAGHVQPLLGFGNRAVVHFAVSNDEAWMTIRLAGDDTHFLPFNMGCDGGAGIADEAHSSQSGQIAANLKAVLTA